MQIEKTKLFGLPVEAHSDISKIGGGKKEKSDHLCIAEVSQITVAQFAREQVYQKHSCPKSKDLVDNKNNFAKRKKKKVLHQRCIMIAIMVFLPSCGSSSIFACSLKCLV